MHKGSKTARQTVARQYDRRWQRTHAQRTSRARRAYSAKSRCSSHEAALFLYSSLYAQRCTNSAQHTNSCTLITRERGQAKINSAAKSLKKKAEQTQKRRAAGREGGRVTDPP